MFRSILGLSLLLVTSSAPAALAPGAPAPDFTTQGALAGKPFFFTLKQALKKGPVVLYFFPAAFTPGCTVEAHDFAEATPEFNKLGATVIGMSADTLDKLQRFSVEECRNKFAVATATPAVIKGYDVALPVRPGMTNRTSYVIAPNGKIVFAYSAMSPQGHVSGTLDAVKKWRIARK
ncbi:peroxiredoxin [Sphingomonas sp. ID1715]|uniref:peroxiredoxin n=1 Tax=Sphingomonas sp. ID1715 TaxID=1656898 RepID=UPI001488B59F|nr:peroxiredoxin [Sphingomonas sp. ID1715]NNM77402.1 peroxiredoxin [Sphingomonas sp. ID1715]